MTELVLSLGQVATFTATGVDRQDRQIRWRMHHGNPSVSEDFGGHGFVKNFSGLAVSVLTGCPHVDEHDT